MRWFVLVAAFALSFGCRRPNTRYDEPVDCFLSGDRPVLCNGRMLVQGRAPLVIRSLNLDEFRLGELERAGDWINERLGMTAVVVTTDDIEEDMKVELVNYRPHDKAGWNDKAWNDGDCIITGVSILVFDGLKDRNYFGIFLHEILHGFGLNHTTGSVALSCEKLVCPEDGGCALLPSELRQLELSIIGYPTTATTADH